MKQNLALLSEIFLTKRGFYSKRLLSADERPIEENKYEKELGMCLDRNNCFTILNINIHMLS